MTLFMGIFVLPKHAFPTSSQNEFSIWFSCVTSYFRTTSCFWWDLGSLWAASNLNWTRPRLHSPRISPGKKNGEKKIQTQSRYSHDNMTRLTTWWNQWLAAMQFLFCASCLFTEFTAQQLRHYMPLTGLFTLRITVITAHVLSHRTKDN